jgi:hypothetical protein
MNPRYATGFEWNFANVGHLAERGIRGWEVEEVFGNRAEFRRNKSDRAGDYYMIGTTYGGRRLTIVVKTLADTRELRAITGWTTD